MIVDIFLFFLSFLISFRVVILATPYAIKPVIALSLGDFCPDKVFTLAAGSSNAPGGSILDYFTSIISCCFF